MLRSVLLDLAHSCETQPLPSIGWVALSSMFVRSSRIGNTSSHLHYMMFQTIQTIYFLWAYDPGNMSVSSLLSWAQFTVHMLVGEWKKMMRTLASPCNSVYLVTVYGTGCHRNWLGLLLTRKMERLGKFQIHFQKSTNSACLWPLISQDVALACIQLGKQARKLQYLG